MFLRACLRKLKIRGMRKINILMCLLEQINDKLNCFFGLAQLVQMLNALISILVVYS